jgi:hypothetical protein
MTKLLKDAIFEQLKLILPQDDYITWENYKITEYLKQLYDEIELHSTIENSGHDKYYLAKSLLNLEVKEPHEAPTVEPIIKMSQEVKND